MTDDFYQDLRGAVEEAHSAGLHENHYVKRAYNYLQEEQGLLDRFME